MKPQPAVLEVRTRDEWRAWLQAHHASSSGVWLVFRKGRTHNQTLTYEDSVREALCFGWVDSLIKRLDDARYVRKFTPRRPSSRWSDLNRRRWAELKAEGLLTRAGEAAAPTSRGYAPLPQRSGVPPYIAKAFKAHPDAWRFFQTLPAGQQRYYVMWIDMAKRPETRDRRLRESIERLSAGRRLGLK